MRGIVVCSLAWMALSGTARSDPPTANYIFPAGGQRGTKVTARIGGCNLHNAPQLIWSGTGVAAPTELKPTETIWFEGPVIPQPASQQKEDYPRDFTAPLAIATDAPLGRQAWRLATFQGVTTAWGFVVGQFPEIIENEVEGETPAIRVELPVTINGRIFPREDVDAWSFVAKAGQTVTCHVATSTFGSPLDARIEVRSPDGQVLGEQLPEGNVTPALHFVAPTDGEYQVRIHDISLNGLQDHVYRLTVMNGPFVESAYPLGGRRGSTTRLELRGTNLPAADTTVTLPAEGTEHLFRLPAGDSSFGDVRLDLDDFEEVLETESNEETSRMFSVPSILNGRIQTPGDVDSWTFAAKKEVEYDFEVRAARLGSSLDAVLELTDSTGKKQADADDSPGMLTDSRLRWTAPADGDFRLTIRDRLASRGDARFAYRVRAISTEQPEFSLSLTTDAILIERGKSTNVKVSLDRGPGFKEPVVLNLEGLPAGVTVSAPAAPITIAANQREIQLTLKAAEVARIDVAAVVVSGQAKVGDRDIIQRATVVPNNPEPGRYAIADGRNSLWVATTLPTPFKFVGVFETKFISRGAVFVRKYHVDRSGFDGPLEVRLADRQGRHLQGVTASLVIVPAGQSDFEFAVTLPPWMEIGRTCRSTLAISGVISDADGTPRTVNFSSNDQHNQMIALVDPGRFAVQLPRNSITAAPGGRIDLPVRIQRSPGLTEPVSVELVIPESVQGVATRRIEIAGDTSEGTLSITFGDSLTGLQLRPFTIRAATTDERKLPVTAEATLDLVPQR